MYLFLGMISELGLAEYNLILQLQHGENRGLYHLVESLPGLMWVLTLLYLFQLSELLLTEFHQLTLSDLRQLCLSRATEFLVSLKTHM